MIKSFSYLAKTKIGGNKQAKAFNLIETPSPGKSFSFPGIKNFTCVTYTMAQRLRYSSVYRRKKALTRFYRNLTRHPVLTISQTFKTS